MSALDALTHYEVLDVPKTATSADIRSAYRQKALTHHPDKSAAKDATSYFQQIQEAYEVLSSARQRYLYDAGIRNLAAREANRMRDELARQRATEDQDLQRSILKTRLIEACKAGLTADVMRLLRGIRSSDVNAVDQIGRTALQYAAERRSTQIVSLLILYQGDVNATDLEGCTPIGLCVGSVPDSLGKDTDDASCLLSLLRAKANPNAKMHGDVTALLLACAGGSLSWVQALLDHSADASVGDEAGVTPLALAADSGHAEIVRALLKASAPVDVPDSSGKTALMSASARAYDDVVSILLEAGADTQASTADGCSALFYATAFLGNECASHAVDDRERERAISIASMLLGARADPNAAADDGRTPMSLALLTRDGSIVKILGTGGTASWHQGLDNVCEEAGA